MNLNEKALQTILASCDDNIKDVDGVYHFRFDGLIEVVVTAVRNTDGLFNILSVYSA